jgi:hypothetical protein
MADGLTNKQRQDQAAERAWGLGVTTWFSVFLVCLVTLIICWNVFPQYQGWHGTGVFGLFAVPFVPALIVGFGYFTKATWHIVPGQDNT